MNKVEMVMPKMGESIMEGTILKWLKKEGDNINEDESVLEVATDKVDTEIPSTCSGKIIKILVEEGDIVKVGRPIAVIETSEDTNSSNTNSFIDELIVGREVWLSIEVLPWPGKCFAQAYKPLSWIPFINSIP